MKSYEISFQFFIDARAGNKRLKSSSKYYLCDASCFVSKIDPSGCCAVTYHYWFC